MVGLAQARVDTRHASPFAELSGAVVASHIGDGLKGAGPDKAAGP